MKLRLSVCVAWLAGLWVMGAANWSSADQIYDIDFDQSSYIVAPGGTIDVTILLRETVTGGDTARLAPGNNDGIFFMGVGLDFSSVASGPGSIIGAETDVTINPQFNDSFVNDIDLDLGASMLIVDAATTDPNGIEVGPVSANVYEVELATITFTAGALGSVTDLTLSDNPDLASLTVFADSFVIDSIASYGSSSISVATVPEPTALGALGLIALGLLRRKR